jgi:hypothetical protein
MVMAAFEAAVKIQPDLQLGHHISLAGFKIK